MIFRVALLDLVCFKCPGAMLHESAEFYTATGDPEYIVVHSYQYIQPVCLCMCMCRWRACILRPIAHTCDRVGELLGILELVCDLVRTLYAIRKTKRMKNESSVSIFILDLVSTQDPAHGALRQLINKLINQSTNASTLNLH